MKLNPIGAENHENREPEEEGYTIGECPACGQRFKAFDDLERNQCPCGQYVSIDMDGRFMPE